MPEIMIDHHARKMRFHPPREAVLAAIVKARGQLPLTFRRGSIERDGDRWTQYNGLPADIIGAIVIAWDMRAVGPDETHVDTAMRVMGQPWEWARGLSDGWAMLTPDLSRMSDLARLNYMAGFELGAEARFAASCICDNCGMRRFKAQQCDRCGA